MSNNNYNFTPRLDGLNNIDADNIDTSNLIADTMNIGTLTVSSLTSTDIITNTLTANTSVNTPLLTGAGNLNISYAGGIYSNSPEYNIDTTGGYGGITFTSQFDVDLQPLTGKINLLGKVSQSTGTRNVSYGLDCMNGTQTGTDNTSFGNGSSQNLNSGINNTSLGSLSLNSNIISNNNVAIGYNALNKTTTSANTAVGSQALANLTTANATVAVGFSALNALTTGTVNSAFGFRALETLTTGDANTGTGSQALRYLQTGLHNTGTGFLSDYNLTTGSFNTSYGSGSGCNDATWSAYNANTCIGYGVNTSGGSYNTYIGFAANSGVFRTTTNYSTGVGYNATPTANNQIMLGTANDTVKCPHALEVVDYINVPTASPGTNNTNVATTEYVDRATNDNNAYLLATTNAWTGLNTYNTILPTSTLTPSSGFQLTNKNYVDNAISGISGYATLSGANAWTGNTNTFNSFLPTSTISATTGNQLTNKTYVDNAITALGAGRLATANAWTGNTNTFNSFLPTSTILATTANQFTNKNYVDTAVANTFEYNKTLTINDDFLTGLNENEVQWTQTLTGSGTGAVQASLVQHPGLYRFSTSTTVGSSAGIAMSQASIFTNNLLSVEWIWRYNTNFNNSVIQIGYANGINSFGISAVFRLQISPANYQFVVNGTAFYTINKEPLLFGLLQNKWLHGKIIIDFAAGTQAFQLTNLTDNITESETQTAAITSAAITPICKISQLGTTASNMDMDFCSFKYSATTRA